MTYKSMINLFSREIWDDLSLIPEVSPHYFSKNCFYTDICQFGSINAWAKSLPEAFPSGLKIHKSTAWEEGNTIIVRWEDCGIHETSIYNAPPTGKRVFIRGVSIGTFENSKIVTWDCCWDYDGFLAQISPNHKAQLPVFNPSSQQQEIQKIIQSWKPLTPKEIFHLSFWVNGRSLKEITSFLEYAVSHRTIETHIRNAAHKLGCHSRGDLIELMHSAEKIHLFRRLYEIYCGIRSV